MLPKNNKVIILLATMNGAEFLPAQLQSYRDQTHANWDLLVSDDGSTDGTLEIIRAFGDRVPQRIRLRQGPRLGFWRNFVSLVRMNDVDGDYFAYSDQDDVWLSEKLRSAILWLQRNPPDVPALYFTRTISITRQGKRVGLSPLFERPPSFQNALVQNIGGGNTMVFNRAARAILLQTPLDAELVSHDWWTYQVVTGVGGIAYYDPRPSVEYRQHNQNLIGSNVGPRARLIRLLAFLDGRVVGWNVTNIGVLNNIRELLATNSVTTLDLFSAARQAPLPRRLYFLWRSGVYRQTILESIGLFVGSLLGRL